MIKTFLEQLSRELKLGSPIPQKEDGSFILSLEPALEISLRENQQSGISLITTLAPLPQEKTEEFVTKLMSANLFGRETGGNVLGLRKDGKEVVLTRLIPIEANYKEFYDVLEDFVNYAESWREETKASEAQGGQIYGS